MITLVINSVFILILFAVIFAIVYHVIRKQKPSTPLKTIFLVSLALTVGIAILWYYGPFYTKVLHICSTFLRELFGKVKASPTKPTEGPRGRGGPRATRHYTLSDKDGSISGARPQAGRTPTDNRGTNKRDPNKCRREMWGTILIPEAQIPKPKTEPTPEKEDKSSDDSKNTPGPSKESK